MQAEGSTTSPPAEKAEVALGMGPGSWARWSAVPKEFSLSLSPRAGLVCLDPWEALPWGPL